MSVNVPSQHYYSEYGTTIVYTSQVYTTVHGDYSSKFSVGYARGVFTSRKADMAEILATRTSVSF